MRQKQQKRVDRAEQVEINELFEVKDGQYRAELTNDRGKERVVLLTPEQVMSSSKDMMYHPHGYVGKYLLAGAKESEEFAQKLYQGIVNELSDVEQKIELAEEREDLVEALELVSDSEVAESIQSRIDEISKEVPERVNVDRLEDTMKNLKLAEKVVAREEFSVERKIEGDDIENILEEVEVMDIM